MTMGAAAQELGCELGIDLVLMYPRPGGLPGLEESAAGNIDGAADLLDLLGRLHRAILTCDWQDGAQSMSGQLIA